MRGLTPGEKIVAKSSGLYRLLKRGPTQIEVLSEGIEITRPGNAVTKIHIGSIDGITVQHTWSRSQLRIRIGDGTEHWIGGLDEREAKRVHDTIRVEALRLTSALGRRLLQLDEKLSQLLGGSRYVRHSETNAFHADLKSELDVGRKLVQEHLIGREREALNRLAPYEFVEELEAAREQANGFFVTDNFPAAKRTGLPAPISDEQAKAVVTDEEVTLVLAGAGTGKTSVIVGKVAHLVRNEAVPPQEILVLAFNRKAAENIRKRLGGDLATTEVKTFHAFGLEVIAQTEGLAPTISELARDEMKLTQAVDSIIEVILQDPNQSRALIDFIANLLTPYRPAYDFNTLAEYMEYVRRAELRTLNGELVNSFEELTIANFLAINGIEYKYEEKYEKPTATREHRQYQPDFFLTNDNIYIEHFALKEDGQPPEGWPKYLAGVEWKRSIHQKYGTHLIETFSWQHERGELLKTLHETLEAAGVSFNPICHEELVRRLKQQGERITRMVYLLKTFLNHVKTSGLSLEKLRKRGRGDWRRNKRFLDVFEQVHERYEQLLVEEGALDFHDLIIRAAHYIKDSKWKRSHEYVLVDEFQDISAGRMALLQALRQENTAYFLVGDDWQSIYRFAGSDVGLVRHCGEWLGHVKERSLSQTFRFGKGIGDPSTDFVRRNSEQTQRELLPRPENSSKDEGLTVVADGDPRRAIEEIASRAGGEDLPVLVLGRYNDSKKGLPKELQRRFITVHKAKGLEAEFAVVLGLKNERRGFPSQIEDDPLLELVLPLTDEGAYPFAEERRLFYVAMTRAKRGVYLVTDPKRPSAFVRELLQNFPDLRQLGEFPPPDPPCPRCHSGQLILSQSSKNLRCSNYPYCQHLAPRCPVCAVGYTVVKDQSTSACTNPVCDHAPKVCPICRVGVLERKSSRYGPFWGCSEYRSLPPCRYKRDDRKTAKITGRIAGP